MKNIGVESAPGCTAVIVIVSLTFSSWSPSDAPTLNWTGVAKYVDGIVNVAVSVFAVSPSVNDVSSEKEPPPVNL